MKNILLINGHPDKDSFCYAISSSYKKGAKSSGAKINQINLIDLNFNPVLKYGYRKRTELEPDLLECQQLITDAEHIVFIYPTWWGTQPAILKGFIDRVFLPGFAFKYRDNSLLWDKLLKGKSAHLIVTMDTPGWYYNLIYGRPGHNAIKKCVLNFCGINPVKISTFGPVKSASERKKKEWLDKAEKLGLKMK